MNGNIRNPKNNTKMKIVQMLDIPIENITFFKHPKMWKDMCDEEKEYITISLVGNGKADFLRTFLDGLEIQKY